MARDADPVAIFGYLFAPTLKVWLMEPCIKFPLPGLVDAADRTAVYNNTRMVTSIEKKTPRTLSGFEKHDRIVCRYPVGVATPP